MRYTPFYNHFNMEKHCTMVYFSLRESKQNKKGLSPIEVSISTNGKRIYFSTGKYARSTDWNREKQLVKGKSEEAQLVNSYLTQLRNKIYQKEIELLQMGYLITAELLKEAVADKVEALNEKSLFEVFEEHNREQEKLVGNGVSKATYWISVYTVRLLKEFVQQKYKREDLYLRELNLSFIQSFHTFLRIDKGMAQNSSTKHLKLRKNAGTTERDGRNDAKRLCTNVVTVSDEVKPKKRKMQGKAEYSRRTVCKSLPKKM